jgi:hypothetical protein
MKVRAEATSRMWAAKQVSRRSDRIVKIGIGVQISGAV